MLHRSNARRFSPLLALLLCACAAPAVVFEPTAPLQNIAAAPTDPAPSAAPPAPVAIDPFDLATRRLLAYHEQLRQYTNAELAQEITRLNAAISANPSAAPPAAVLELALALVQNRANADLPRALTLLDPLIRASNSELAPWQAMARLISARLADQRRTEEQLERTATQLRDAQRNLVQTSEKLEALKAIERSLNAKPSKTP